MADNDADSDDARTLRPLQTAACINRIAFGARAGQKVPTMRVDVGRIDPQVFDLLCRVQQALGSARAFEVISGYRCPATNTRLRESRGGGVAMHSLDKDGRAIDVPLPGVPLADLRDAALQLRAGGVGFYPRDQFVHIDTGRVRAW